jgi:hypothetical protein
MKPVKREEILDYMTYGEQRDAIRREAMKQKEARRIHLGDYLTFLFENRVTVRYQIQEMVRVEQIVKESDIEHEIETYNELLGGPGELGCTLMIEIDDPDQRDGRLSQWLELPNHLYAKLESGKKAYARFDARQVGESRLSSVQYMRFNTEGETPVALGADHPQLSPEVQLTNSQRQALTEDLKE